MLLSPVAAETSAPVSLQHSDGFDASTVSCFAEERIFSLADSLYIIKAIIYPRMELPQPPMASCSSV